MDNPVYRVLSELSIEFLEFHHPPVMTVREAEKHWKGIEGTHCKNLFLRDHKGRKHFLVIMPHQKEADLKELSTALGSRLSFASEQRLDKYLGLKPGSVSPFGLINDTESHVHVYLEEELKQATRLGFHPNINTITITISAQDFHKFLAHCGNEITWFR